jgi:diguanylate cyclase (GGDEF)-like protein
VRNVTAGSEFDGRTSARLCGWLFCTNSSSGNPRRNSRQFAAAPSTAVVIGLPPIPDKPLDYLTATYNPWVVVTSLLIATFASYVALDLSQRIERQGSGTDLLWWAYGSLALGTGIWCMHFLGMLALTLPIAIGFAPLSTIGSWAAAVATSGVALHAANTRALTAWRLACGALAMGAGICATHYIGMAALDMAPGIDWSPRLIAASVGVAVAASAVALAIFFWLRGLHGRHSFPSKLAASFAMGLAISGMHYTGMAAAQFPAGSICLSAGQMGGTSLGGLLTLGCAGMLALVLFTSSLDARLQRRAARLAGSLEQANAQLKSANDELKQMAFSDALTGLPNRPALEERLAQAIHRCERRAAAATADTHARVAVLFVDLDGFKAVNDSLGHGAGDLVLRETAARLHRASRGGDTLARIGGDEFVLLMEDVVDIDCPASAASRLLELLAAPIDVAGRQVSITGSIGVAVYPDHGQLDKLVIHADSAMYAAKRAGGNSFVLFDARMDAGAVDPLSLQSDLRQAIARGQLSLHYQPKVRGPRAAICGVEALLRWNHPERGMVSPALFIPIAERFGLINSLGDWVVDEACRQMQEWQEAGLRLHVAINLSVHQLRGHAVVDRLARALLRHGIDPDLLMCEITESAAMEDIKVTQGTLEGLRRIGTSLSIDDFGTGYSSLSYLRQLSARQLKIDRSFVRDIEVSDDARAIVDGVIRLSHAIGLTVVAEGVETAGQRDILLALACDEMQGYLFARPMPSAQLIEWVHRHEEWPSPLPTREAPLLAPAPAVARAPQTQGMASAWP